MLSNLSRGLVRDNPLFVLLLGMCPSLAVTLNLKFAVGMGLALTFVLACSNVIVSLLRRLVPNEVRLPVFIVIIATFVTLTDLAVQATSQELKEALGVFLPLIVVNCIVLGRAEGFACRNGMLASLLDGIGMGLGYTLAICIVSAIREVLGAGSLWGIPLADGLDPWTIKAMLLAPGGFLTLGLLLALFTHLAARRARAAEARP